MMAMYSNVEKLGFPLQDAYLCRFCGEYHLSTIKESKHD